MNEHDDYSRLEGIYDALDAGDPERALELASAAAGDTDPVLRFLRGTALLELGRADEAVRELQGAVGDDPDDAEFRALLARALYHACRFEEARPHAEAALGSDPRLPDAHDVHGLLLETDGDTDGADAAFARATSLDREGFPPPLRLEPAAFEEQVRLAEERLPDTFRSHLAEVAVSVEPVPPRDVLLAEQPPLDPALLGLFVGVSLAERTHFSPGGELPPRIYLFQRNLERYAVDGNDLREQIAITLYHELGHYLGLDEGELADIDLA